MDEERRRIDRIEDKLLELSRSVDERFRISRSKWADALQVFGMLITAVIALASLMISWNAEHRQNVSNVELGALAANSEGKDRENPWQIWYARYSDQSAVVGVQRWVKFTKPFQNVPDVHLAFKIIDIEDLEQNDRLRTWRAQFDPKTRIRLDGVHIVTWATDVNQDGFRAHIGINMPATAATSMNTFLRNTPVDPYILSITQGTPQMTPGQESEKDLSPETKWMLNFYTYIGSFDVIWIAKEGVYSS